MKYNLKNEMDEATQRKQSRGEKKCLYHTKAFYWLTFPPVLFHPFWSKRCLGPLREWSTINDLIKNPEQAKPHWPCARPSFSGPPQRGQSLAAFASWQCKAKPRLIINFGVQTKCHVSTFHFSTAR